MSLTAYTLPSNRTMKLLPTQFHKKGWEHQQLVRLADVAIYERWKEGQQARHYEVVRIRQCKESTGTDDKGRVYKRQAQEVYPSSVDWGLRGWTYQQYEDAQKKFRELTESAARKSRTESQPQSV